MSLKFEPSYSQPAHQQRTIQVCLSESGLLSDTFHALCTSAFVRSPGRYASHEAFRSTEAELENMNTYLTCIEEANFSEAGSYLRRIDICITQL